MHVRQVVPREAIPSVDDPTFGPDYDGAADDRVVVYDPDGGPARAYPLRSLNYHEVVNDVADRPMVSALRQRGRLRPPTPGGRNGRGGRPRRAAFVRRLWQTR